MVSGKTWGRFHPPLVVADAQRAREPPELLEVVLAVGDVGLFLAGHQVAGRRQHVHRKVRDPVEVQIHVHPFARAPGRARCAREGGGIGNHPRVVPLVAQTPAPGRLDGADPQRAGRPQRRPHLQAGGFQRRTRVVENGPTIPQRQHQRRLTVALVRAHPDAHHAADDAALSDEVEVRRCRCATPDRSAAGSARVRCHNGSW